MHRELHKRDMVAPVDKLPMGWCRLYLGLPSSIVDLNFQPI